MYTFNTATASGLTILAASRGGNDDGVMGADFKPRNQASPCCS